MREVVQIINSGCQPYQNLGLLKRIEELGGKPAALQWVTEALTRGLGAAEVLVAKYHGTYAVGDSPTMADAFLFPQVRTSMQPATKVAPGSGRANRGHPDPWVHRFQGRCRDSASTSNPCFPTCTRSTWPKRATRASRQLFRRINRMLSRRAAAGGRTQSGGGPERQPPGKPCLTLQRAP